MTSRPPGDPHDHPPPRAVEAVRRVVALLPSVVRAAETLAWVSAGVVLSVWVLCAVVAPPDGSLAWLTRSLLLLAGLAPAIVLKLFVSGVSELGELPERYRRFGADVRSGVADLRTHDDARRWGPVRSFVALARIAIGARDIVSPFAIVAAALRPALIVGALVAAVIALVEVPVAIVILAVVVL